MSDGSTLSEPKRPALDLPTAADQPQRRRLAGLFSMVVTLALLAMIVDQFRHMKLAAIAAMVPVSAGFWIAFAAYYLVQPLSELVIYR
ncbi:MAG: hypothetical protein KDE30_09350, partial [Novosphingobium sp.]|nr:hypothetical protein [Novosphingobium sp.]